MQPYFQSRTRRCRRSADLARRGECRHVRVGGRADPRCRHALDQFRIPRSLAGVVRPALDRGAASADAARRRRSSRRPRSPPAPTTTPSPPTGNASAACWPSCTRHRRMRRPWNAGTGRAGRSASRRGQGAAVGRSAAADRRRAGPTAGQWALRRAAPISVGPVRRPGLGVVLPPITDRADDGPLAACVAELRAG